MDTTTRTRYVLVTMPDADEYATQGLIEAADEILTDGFTVAGTVLELEPARARAGAPVTTQDRMVFPYGPHAPGWTPLQARRLAADILAAADVAEARA